MRGGGDRRKALVTGASSGIGAAIAHRLLDEGFALICLGLRQEDLRAGFDRYGASVAQEALDFTDIETLAATLESRLPAWGAIDVLVNCAGTDAGGMAPFHEVDPMSIRRTMAVNLVAPMIATRLVLPGMVGRGRGDVVNIGSVLGRKPGNLMASYTASKFGLHGFSEALRQDLRETDIRVTEILPGAVRTDFARNRWPDDRDRADAFYRQFPMTLEAEDIARTVSFVLAQPPHVQLETISVLPSRL